MVKLTLEYWLEEGWYAGRLREIPEVFGHGKSFAEMRGNIQEAFNALMRRRPRLRHPVQSRLISLSN